VLGPDPARADSIAEKTAICAGCHGEKGAPQEKTTPAIWGQKEGYLYLQLRDYASGARRNDVMGPLAQALEKSDMLALAAYFADKPWPDLGQPRAPKDVAERALTANGSVGCTGCHLDQWQGYGTVPRLAGMSRDYLAKTIAEFRSRSRANNPGMSDLMVATSEDDLAALAQYLAGL
jgi:cytochrome c553